MTDDGLLEKLHHVLLEVHLLSLSIHLVVTYPATYGT